MKKMILNMGERVGLIDSIHLINFRFLTIVFVLLLVLVPVAWGQEIEWIRQFGSTEPADDFAEAVDADGNVYIAGKTNDTLPGQTSAGGIDAFVCKYDVDGYWQWTCQFGTEDDDYAYGISVDATGVYVVGYTYGTLQGQTSTGGTDAFVCKYDVDGNWEWTCQFGTEKNDQARGISIDATGVYVAGWTYGDFPGQTSAGGCDAFVRKYDLSGTEEPVWTRQFGTLLTDYAYGISVYATGVYVAGFTFSGYDAFVYKYDSDGNFVWTRQFGTGTTSYDNAYGISVDGTGIYVAGSTNGTFTGQTGAGSYDAFVRKYDLSGTEEPVWTRQFGTTAEDYAYGISVDATGVYIAGKTFGTLPLQSSAGGRDAFVRKYDLSGTELWTRQFGTESDDEAHGISVDATRLYVSGYTNGTFPGQTSSGDFDAFVVKLIQGSANQPPIVEAITAPDVPFPVNMEIEASADFTDPDLSDTHTAKWYWGDGETSDGDVVEANGSGTVTGSHIYTAAGVYTDTLIVWDDYGDSDTSVFQYVVVFDPSDGYVTGGGWIDSPAGAYTPDPSLTGKANFGFVSKYYKSKSIPVGNTQFNFKTADFKFHNTSYDWLIISGPHVRFKGSGTINGSGDYGFMLTAIDGQVSGGGGVDKFRIRIWDKATEQVVYDNQLGDPDDPEVTDAIEGGSIVIHKEAGLPKNGNFAEDIEPEAKPRQFALFQNYPNPFNPETMISFQIPQANHVIVRIFNTLGVEIRKVVNGRYEAGNYSVIWDGKDNSGRPVASGTYIYQIQAGQFVDIKKMALIR